jgi:putative Mg2+ transporter-C (MgtC) family protein
VWVLLTETFRLDLLGELLLAVLIGGLIGFEREASGKPAGLRTNILICLGATLITDVSLNMGIGLPEAGRADAARLSAQIVSGIGFLGAGTIMQARGMVTGLTSAATLWVVAAIGIAIGAQHTVEAVGTAFLVLLILVPMGRLERRLSVFRRARVMVVELPRHVDPAVVGAILNDAGLVIHSQRLEVDKERLLLRIELVGPAEGWHVAEAALIQHPEIRGMRIH